MPTSQHWQFDQHLANDLDVGHAAIEDLMKEDFGFIYTE